MSAITKSARGQDCQVRIFGVCNGNPETVIWSHINLQAAGKGRGIKAVDIAGAYSCSSCHDVYEGRAKRPKGISKQDIEFDMAMAHYRSLVILVEKGII